MNTANQIRTRGGVLLAVLAVALCALAFLPAADAEPAVPSDATEISSLSGLEDNGTYVINGSITVSGIVNAPANSTIYIAEGGSISTSEVTDRLTIPTTTTVYILNGGSITYVDNTLVSGEIIIYPGGCTNYRFVYPGNDTPNNPNSIVGGESSSAYYRLSSGTITMSINDKEAAAGGFTGTLDGKVAIVGDAAATFRAATVTITPESEVSIEGSLKITNNTTMINYGSVDVKANTVMYMGGVLTNNGDVAMASGSQIALGYSMGSFLTDTRASAINGTGTITGEGTITMVTADATLQIGQNAIGSQIAGGNIDVDVATGLDPAKFSVTGGTFTANVSEYVKGQSATVGDTTVVGQTATVTDGKVAATGSTVFFNDSLSNVTVVFTIAENYEVTYTGSVSKGYISVSMTYVDGTPLAQPPSMEGQQLLAVADMTVAGSALGSGQIQADLMVSGVASGDSVAVVYYDGTTEERMGGVTVSDGKVTFTTDHNSRYYVYKTTGSSHVTPPLVWDDDEEDAVIGGATTSEGKDDTVTIVACAAAAVVAALLAAFLILDRRP